MKSESKYNGPKLFQTISNDFSNYNLTRTVSKDYKELIDYMLSGEQKNRLKKFGFIKKWLFIAGWLFSALLLKLTPTRRILLVAGIILVLIDIGNNFNQYFLMGWIIVFFVLLLELKDKLMAREELEAGRVVQSALMPVRSPDVPGWRIWLYTRSANEVGGDLVDFIKINENHFGITLADVAGKGLRAALMAVKIQSTIRALIQENNLSEETISKLNHIFIRDSLPNFFATLVFLEIQSNSNSVSVINAGHFPALIFSNNKISKTEKGDLAIGLRAKTDYRKYTIQMNKNDLMVIYSDGVTEAQNESGDFFGENRLISAVQKNISKPFDSIGENLLFEIDGFVDNHKTNDDISLVLIKKFE